MSTPSPRKSWWRRWFGSRSERAASRYLKRQGYRILRRNYSCPVGEVDLVACEDRTLVFVEVRSTQSEDAERTAHSVDETKQKKLTKTALYFLQRHRLLDHPARFDVLVISWPPDQSEPLIEHHRHAFEATGNFS